MVVFGCACPKLTKDHLWLSSCSKTSVDLPAQVHGIVVAFILPLFITLIYCDPQMVATALQFVDEEEQGDKAFHSYDRSLLCPFRGEAEEEAILSSISQLEG